MPSTQPADHRVTVNGRTYRLPDRPTVVITIDGCAVEYLTAALEAGHMPNLASLLAPAGGGFYADALSEMPSLTNPNNVSIITGVSPAVHGIIGNYYRDPTGTERQLNLASDLRAQTIHAAAHQRGVPVLMVTAKEKLRQLLGAGGVPSVSVEHAASQAAAHYGDGTIAELVGRPAPHIYDWDASIYALDIGLAAHRHAGPLSLLYVSFTDYVQHREPPGSPLANRFYAAVDDRLAHYLNEGFLIGITADHGMNAKHHPDGSPRLIHLEDTLVAAGITAQAVLPITDPYTAHHGALGSFAWIHTDNDHHHAAIELLGNTTGVAEVYPGAEAATIFELPPDLVGDIAITADRHTVLGSTNHTGITPPAHLRSHGGRHEQRIPLILSERPTNDHLTARQNRPLRNRDIHDLILNCLIREH